MSPRYHVRYWHFRYNLCFLVCSVAFLGFYCYATFSTPTSDQMSRSWKLLVGYTLLLNLDVIYRVVLLVRMHAFLSRHGEGETDELPMEGLQIFDVFSHAASAYFVVACWITHAQFPLRPCDDMSYRLACSALHCISFCFVGWLSLTVLVILVSTSCSCLSRRTQRPRPVAEGQEGSADYNHPSPWALQSALRSSGIPGHPLHNLSGHLIALQAPLRRRFSQVHALPTTQEPPLDGDVCGVCLEGPVETDDGAGVPWRLLPCGHRFHTLCVDDWLCRLDGACPTCRKDPILAMNSGIPPLSELRGGVQGEETELDVLQDVGFVSTQGDIEQGVIQGAMVPVGTWDGEGEGAVEDGDGRQVGIAGQRVTVSETDNSAEGGADAADRAQMPMLLPSEVPDAMGIRGDDASQGDTQGGGHTVISGETRGLESLEASPARQRSEEGGAGPRGSYGSES
eukprot:Tamp_05597.p1 GENE.Tamp_05597~~Tamp_05597.p1  ORF type:complete len:480 (-),score=52.92 Tamp_05597:1489-2850(-)